MNNRRKNISKVCKCGTPIDSSVFTTVCKLCIADNNRLKTKDVLLAKIITDIENTKSSVQWI